MKMPASTLAILAMKVWISAGNTATQDGVAVSNALMLEAWSLRFGGAPPPVGMALRGLPDMVAR